MTPKGVISPKEFVYSGLPVVELLFPLMEYQVLVWKLVWVRSPFEEMVVDGKKNPLLAVSIPVDSNESVIDQARLICQDLFEKYWYSPFYA